MSNKTRSNSPSTAIQSDDDRGLKSWLPWLLLTLLGLTGWVLSDLASVRERITEVKTDAVAQRIKSVSVAAAAEAVQSAQGVPGSVDRMLEFRRQLDADIVLLQRGGFYSPSDSTPIPAINTATIPLPALITQLDTFAAAAAPVSAAADSLKKSATAEQTVPLMVRSLAATSSRLAQSSSTSTGPWGAALNPIRADLSSRDLQGLEFTLLSGGGQAALATIEQRVREADQLANLSAKDSRLSAADRQLVVDLAAAAKSLAESARDLLGTASARQSARAAIPEIRAAAQGLAAAADDVATAVRQPRRSMLPILVYIFAALSGAGLIGMTRALWVNGFALWRARQNSARGQQAAAAIDRVARNLRQIILRESSATRINEPSESPLFVVASQVNQVLSQRDQAVSIMESQSEGLQQGVGGVDSVTAILSLHSEEQSGILDRATTRLANASSSLVKTVQDIENIQSSATNAVELVHRGGAYVQENVWRMEALRENTQRNAKRIKRLGESTQSLSTSVDMISGAIKMIKVIGLNMAIEAAPRGESGRSFSAMARELERLVQSGDQAIRDVVIQIDALQSDAKETVSAMEESTSDVVDSTKISTDLGLLFKDVERVLERVLSETSLSVRSTEDVALVMVEEKDSLQEIKAGTDSFADLSRKTKEHNDLFRAALSDIKKWLTAVGKNN